jgi:nucleoside-diphosphate-sugar epimerase
VSVNVRAVDALLHAAARAGVERLVHVSTILTLPPNRAAPVTGAARTPTLYEWTKREGERRVEAHVRAGRHAVIVHPARVYGPGPLHDGNGVTRAIALYLQGRLRLRLNDGDALGSYVHAADVAHGIVAAAERGRPGAHYVLGGENVPFTQLLELATSLTGTRRRVISLPPRAALAVARATELWGRVGGTFVLPRAWIRVLMEDRPVDSGPAVRDLGYAPRPLREGLHQTIDWLARQGLIARGARAA